MLLIAGTIACTVAALGGLLAIIARMPPMRTYWPSDGEGGDFFETDSSDGGGSDAGGGD